MALQLSEFLARVGPEFDVRFVAEHIGTSSLDDVIEYTLDRSDLASLVHAGMKPLHRNKLFKAIQDERQRRVERSSPGRRPLGRLVFSVGVLGGLCICAIVSWKRKRDRERRALSGKDSLSPVGESKRAESGEFLEWLSAFAKAALKDVSIDVLKDLAKSRSLAGSIASKNCVTGFLLFLAAGLASSCVAMFFAKGAIEALPVHRRMEDTHKQSDPIITCDLVHALDDTECDCRALNNLSWASDASTAASEADIRPHSMSSRTIKSARPQLSSLAWVVETGIEGKPEA